jgi:2-haloacid dehalogenase
MPWQGVNVRSTSGQYRGFLIDADNTLFDYNRAEKESLYETLEEIHFQGSFELAHIKYREVDTHISLLIEKGKMDQQAADLQKFKSLFDAFQIRADVGSAVERFIRTLSTKAYVLPNALEVIEFLSRRALLCLYSNGRAAVQRGRFARAEIEVFFHDIVISEDIGVAKPNPEFFRIAASRLPLPLYEILCVGDSPSKDIRGAHSAGMDTCWYLGNAVPYPAQEPQPDYMVTDLRELIDYACDVS